MTSIKEGLDALTNKEYDKALEILFAPAKKGDAKAQNALGTMYCFFLCYPNWL